MKTNLILILFSLLSFDLLAQAVERVEPPNWWIGMKYNQIELMVYGKNVASLRPTINYKGVKIREVKQVENKNYLFINLTISHQAIAGSFKIDFYKNNTKIHSHNYKLKERIKARSSTEGFNSSDVIYLITPDRYANGDPNNDEVQGMKEKLNRSYKGGRHGGDIKGISDRLDYIKDMGFTAIWMNPLLENDMEKYSYHGYSTTDYYKVDPRFGTNEDYRELCETARHKGIKVIMDMIANHCGSEHWWMEDLPMGDWINQWEKYTPTNHKKTTLLDPYAAEADKKIYSDGWFVKTMPDLNQRNDYLGRYYIQNTLWWIEYLGLSGIRMDTYSYPDLEYMALWAKTVMEEYPNFNIVGEEWYHLPTVIAYIQDGNHNADGYRSYLKSVMDFPLQIALTKALNQEKTWTSSWTPLYEAIGQDYLYPDPYNLVVFPDNHDMSRIYTQLNEDVELYKMAMIYLLTTRGIPQIYYGTEILMGNKGTSDHGIIRTDFPGGWKGDTVNPISQKGLTTQQKSAQDFLKQLLNWRKDATVIHNGQFLHFVPDNDDVYVYFRYNDAEKVMVILNKNQKEVELELKRFNELLEGHQNAKNIITNKSIALGEKITIPPRSGMVLELN